MREQGLTLQQGNFPKGNKHIVDITGRLGWREGDGTRRLHHGKTALRWTD